MSAFDAIIIGGGPAGSSAAWALTRAGLQVAIIDKAAFPRDKICAGWVTPAVLETLEVDLDHYRQGRVLQPIHGFVTGTIGRDGVSTRYDGEAVSYGIRRVEFDHYLLARSGATLLTGVKVDAMVREAGAWTVNDKWRAPLLIGAGGHFCPVARMLGARPGSTERTVAAQEFEVELTGEQARDCAVEEDTPELYFCPDLKGYGWVFRKQGVVNVGLGREDSKRIARHVREFCDGLVAAGRLPASVVTKFKGHAYVLHAHSSRRVRADGVVLIGDAIGLAYTQSGEGIRPAVESALLAAEHIVAASGHYDDDGLAGFETAMAQRFGSRGRDGMAAYLPDGWKRALGGRLLNSAAFARHVVLDRWFLHRAAAPLHWPPRAPSSS